MVVVKTGAIYFALVFAAGFVLGTIRTLWVVPALGARNAELAEAPVMVLVSFFVARWIVGRFLEFSTSAARLAVGIIALALMLVTEFTVVLWIRGLTIREYWPGRDPVSGTVYFVSLGLFAVMPLLAGMHHAR
ncbi:MAG TPA: hypothetical protein VJA94_25675 [Candidatus Angelobacter sp.]